jgi:hypothetical protein
MKVNVDYTIGLQQGDLIGVNYPTGLWPAIFRQYGETCNPQFWLLSRERLDFYLSNNQKPYTDYMVRQKYGSIVKIDPAVVDQTTVNLYNDYKSYLKSKGSL